MTWDSTWEAVHQSRQWGVNPLPDFASFMLRHCHERDVAESTHVLDIGCGGGASTVYLARYGFKLHAIDGSPSAVALTKRRLEELGLTADVRVMDADRIEQEFEAESMDWALDVSTLQCCRPAGQRRIVRQIQRVLKPRGIFYSRHTATGCWGEGTGTLVDGRWWENWLHKAGMRRWSSSHTYSGITEGPARGVGVQHFASRDYILSLFDWLDLDGHLCLDQRATPDWRHWWLEWVIEGWKR